MARRSTLARMAIDMTGYGKTNAPGAGMEPPSANPFDLLSPEEFEALQTEAEAAMQGQEQEAAETPADEASETPEEQAAEEAAGTEMHTPEQMAEIATSAFEDAGSCVSDIEAMLDQAEQNDDSDPKAIKKLLAQAEDLRDEIETAKEDAEAAVSAEDVGKAAESAAEAERLVEELRALHEEAQGHVGTPPPVEEAQEEGGEATNGAKGAPAGKAPPKGKEKPKPALSIWAARAS